MWIDCILASEINMKRDTKQIYLNTINKEVEKNQEKPSWGNAAAHNFWLRKIGEQTLYTGVINDISSINKALMYDTKSIPYN